MMKKTICALLLVASLTGCMGHNALGAKALKFNLTTAENPWTREALFLGMMIIPVYPLFALADLFVFNTLEFWTGSNMLNGKPALLRVPRSDLQDFGLEHIQLSRIQRIDERKALLYVEFENGDRVTFDVLRDGDSYTISYGDVEFYRGDVKS